MEPITYSVAELGFDKSCVSQNAVEVIKGLQSAGFDGYLVGGCVRDLLMGKKPKDFDVTTDASPEQIKKMFARTRIVGRRFKIVHVSFGRGREREIIEVATYRAVPGSAGKNRARNKGTRGTASHSGRILDDNVYGTIDADVIRRDFTVNALYYDPCKETVLDFVGGIADARSKTLKIIGDVNLRFAEDPVRMIRVVRFQAKLGLRAGKSIASAVESNAALLTDIPAARLFEEVLKLFHYAAAVKSWWQLSETLLLYYLFPQTVECINGEGGNTFESLILSALNNTDKRVEQNKPVIAAYLFAVLLWQPFKIEYKKLIAQAISANEAFWMASDLVFKRQSRSVAVSLRVKAPTCAIWEMQSLLEKRVPRAVEKLLENRRFRAAYDFLLLRHETGEVGEDIVNWWSKIQYLDFQQRQPMIDALPSHSSRNKNKPSTPQNPHPKKHQQTKIAKNKMESR